MIRSIVRRLVPLMILCVSFPAWPVDLAWAGTRAKWEPLSEATQIKGDGEAHPYLSPNDRFADYETWDPGNFDLSVLEQADMLQSEYARTGLQTGLQIEQRLGMIGSTDSHTGLATAGEDNFFGKHSGAEPGPKPRVTGFAWTPRCR